MSKYHDILGVAADASKDDIKKAYRKMASKHHPDKGGDETQFKNVQEAYERLTNPEKFAHEQQQQWHSSRGSRGGHPGFDPFESQVRSHFEELLRRQNQTLRMHLELNLESTLHDQTRTIHVPEYNIPPMEITIPAGVCHGDAIQYPNIPSQDGISTGQRILVIQFIIRQHPDFHIMDRVHLVRYATVDALEAMVGTTITVETIEGKALNVKVPFGTQNGQKLKIPAHGLKYKENPSIRGDMYVEVLITVPFLIESEREIINELIKKRN